jgi:ribonuclease HI
MEILNIYVDGSFLEETVGWAFIILDSSDKVVHSASGTLSGEISSMHQVGGELKAVLEAISYCKKCQKVAKLFYDYEGIEKWVADLFGGKPWKTNNQWTQKYRAYLLENKGFIHSMEKVKSHTGNVGNELVDSLAKDAIKKKKELTPKK